MFDGMLSLLWIDSGASSRSMSMMYCAGRFLVFLKSGAISVSTAGVGCMVKYGLVFLSNQVGLCTDPGL